MVSARLALHAQEAISGVISAQNLKAIPGGLNSSLSPRLGYKGDHSESMADMGLAAWVVDLASSLLGGHDRGEGRSTGPRLRLVAVGYTGVACGHMEIQRSHT